MTPRIYSRHVRPLAVLVLLAVAVAAAGCGARSSKPFTAAGTLHCLKDKGFTGVTSSPAKVGFIAAVAGNGGIKGTSASGNTITIAFADDDSEVPSTEQAFRLHAPPTLRPHIGDVMRSSRNAVLVWTTTPSGADESAVEGCLSP
jgi:hypothetical protein